MKASVIPKWGSAEIIAAARKWQKFKIPMYRELTESLIRFADIQPGMNVLDLASGSGEPALEIANVILPNGYVTATDISSMIELAEENAAKENISNINFLKADVHSLPFGNNSFDRITSRFGVMFFTDIEVAMKECMRVLKPGGKITFMVWDALAKQQLSATIDVVLKKHIIFPIEEPGVFTPFRFAAPGSLSKIFALAGFDSVREECRKFFPVFNGTPEQYCEYYFENSPFVRPMIENLTGAKREQVFNDAKTAVGNFFNGKIISGSIEVILVSGIK